MRRSVILVFLSLVLLFGCKKEEIKNAPYFEVTGLDGKIYRLTDYKGKKLLLLFWGTWCPTCKELMKDLSSKIGDYKAKNVEVLAISIDEDRNRVLNTVKELGFESIPIAVATPQTIFDYQGVRFLPTCYLIDENGLVVKKYVGEVKLQEIESIISSRNSSG